MSPKRRTPVGGVPLNEFSEDAITGVIEGEELEQARARRATPERFRKLEDFKDKAVEVFSAINGTLREHKVILDDLHDDLKARRADVADAVKHSRERWTLVLKLAAGVAGSGVLGALVHWLVTR